MDLSPIENYFTAERAEALLFVLIGVLAIMLSLYFLIKIKKPFFAGIACSLMAIALIQIVVGASVYFRSPKDIQRVSRYIQSEPAHIAQREIPRMQLVMANFSVYKIIEIGLLVLGLLMFVFLRQHALWRGVGMGLMLQAGFMLGLDFLAENRGRVYLDYLLHL